jgi:hypothetical protein
MLKQLTLALSLLALPAYAADAPKPPAQPQISPTDVFTVTLAAAGWQRLLQDTDSTALTAEIERQIQEQWAKAHPTAAPNK